MPYLNCTYASLWVSNKTAFDINATTVGVINVTFSIPTIVLNVLVLNAFIRKRKLRKSSNMILLSLSITDVLSGIFIQPLFAISVFNAVHFNPGDDYPCWLVKGSGIGGYVLACISLVTVSFISLERYIAIFHPFVYSRNITSKVIKRTCIVLWVIPFTVVLTIYLCKRHDLFFWLNGVFIACIYVWNIAIYIRITRQVYNVRRELLRLHSRFSSEKTIATQSKVTQVAGSIIVALLLCYLPQVVGAVLRIILRHIFLLEFVEYWTVTLALISPCLNPLFYCYYNSEIRKEVFFVLKYVGKENFNRSASHAPKPAAVVNSNNHLNPHLYVNVPSKYISSEGINTRSRDIGIQNTSFDGNNVSLGVSDNEQSVVTVETVVKRDCDHIEVKERDDSKDRKKVDIEEVSVRYAENEGFQGDSETYEDDEPKVKEVVVHTDEPGNISIEDIT